MSSPAAAEFPRCLRAISAYLLGAVSLLIVLTLAFGDSRLVALADAAPWRHGDGWIQDLSNGALLIGYLVLPYALLQAWGRARPGYFSFALYYLTTQLLVSVAMVRLIKMLAGRPRPQFRGTEDLMRVHGLVFDPEILSFPSGHATDLMVSAVFIAVLLRRPRDRALLLGLAVAVCTLRVVLVKHWPTDVIAGILLGSGSAVLALWLWYQRHGRQAALGAPAVPLQGTDART